MGFQSLPVDSDPGHPDWRQIEELLDELAEVAKSTLSPGEFYRLTLDRMIPASGASGGAIWSSARCGELRLDYQLNLNGTPGPLESGVLVQHQSLVEQVLHSARPSIVPLARHAVEHSGAEQAAGWAVLHPFHIGPQTSGVVELIPCRAGTAAERQGYARLAAALVELAEDFHRARELGRLRQREQDRDELERFALRAHRSLDTAETAFVIVNEGRRAIGCDRLSVLERMGRKYQTAAVSGVDALDRRGKLIRALERLVERSAAHGEPQWYCDDSGDLPDEIEQPLQSYLDESHARSVAIVPLFGPGGADEARSIVGVLVAEQFCSTARDAELRERLAAVAGHSGVALANAQSHTHQPLARLSRALHRVRWLAEPRQLPKTLLVLGALAAAVAALTFVPADFAMEARGELQPAVRRDVFATDDGVVSELLVRQGQAVRAGDSLLVLRKAALDLELRRVAGEIQTAEKKLAAVQAERLSNARTTDDPRRDAHQRTADEEELKAQLAGWTHERAILEDQRKDLVVRSPIAGQPLTWNLQELLEARPVERGQALLTMADLDGPWVAELRLPDHRTGHLLAARDGLKPDLDVSFALASDPGVEYQGRVADVALSTEMDEADNPSVLVTVAFDRENVAGLRPGATVLARIHCGRRAVGYVWLHELFETIQSHLWW
jgi:multidrug efflux pump subunit AcrA (membrane-fusion protein)